MDNFDFIKKEEKKKRHNNHKLKTLFITPNIRLLPIKTPNYIKEKVESS